jgi:hypothetical protein
MRAVPSSTTLDREDLLLNVPRIAALVVNEGQRAVEHFVHLRPVAANPLRGTGGGICRNLGIKIAVITGT